MFGSAIPNLPDYWHRSCSAKGSIQTCRNTRAGTEAFRVCCCAVGAQFRSAELLASFESANYLELDPANRFEYNSPPLNETYSAPSVVSIRNRLILEDYLLSPPSALIRALRRFRNCSVAYKSLFICPADSSLFRGSFKIFFEIRPEDQGSQQLSTFLLIIFSSAPSAPFPA